MQYLLPCECGQSIQVSETAAGSTAVCGCGRTLPVPSLRGLRRQAGQAAPEVGPEMAVQALLAAGKLPEERDCVLCTAATDGVAYCRTECERAKVVVAGSSRLDYLLGSLLGGLCGAAAVAVNLSRARQTVELGQDLIFTLPLRVCDGCRPGLGDAAWRKDALCRVPLYRRLLAKYPEARITLTS